MKGFEEALELAKDGDDRAVYQLKRIIKRDPTADMAIQATKVLQDVSIESTVN